MRVGDIGVSNRCVFSKFGIGFGIAVDEDGRGPDPD